MCLLFFAGVVVAAALVVVVVVVLQYNVEDASGLNILSWSWSWLTSALPRLVLILCSVWSS